MYEVWYHNPDAVISAMLGNPDFNGQFDLHPYVDLNPDGTCRWNDIMLGNLAWRNSVCSVLIAIFFDVQYIDLTLSRTRSSLWTQVQKEQCIAQSFLGATRPWYWWQLDKSSITLYTYQLVTLTILSSVHIKML